MADEKKSGVNRSQREIRDEWWSDERIQTFLDLESSTDDNAADFHAISKAYQGMVPEAFERFIEFFIEAGRDLNQNNIYGQNNLSIMQEHRNSGDFAEILKKAGAV